MNRKEIEQKHDIICKLISKKQLLDSLRLIKQLLDINPNSDLSNQLNKNISTYKQILSHTVEGIEDNERPEIYKKLLLSTLSLADVVKQNVLFNSHEMTLLNKRKNFSNIHFTKEEAGKIVNELTSNIELDELLMQSEIGETTNDNQKQSEQLEKLYAIFNRIWLTNKYYEADIELVKNIIDADGFPWQEKSLIVTALTFSSLTCFDTEKIKLLIEFVEHKEKQVWQRALSGLVISLYFHDNRLHLYPELMDNIRNFYKAEYEEHFESIIIQLIKSKDTEKFTKKFEKEIVPEIVKNAPKLTEKLDLENILSKENEDEDKNPDWGKIFEDSEGLYKKIEEFSNMQMEGTDIFMGAFSKLKHFPFFNDMHNWFVPFYPENKTIKTELKDEPENEVSKLLKTLKSIPFICNSDKYSFILNYKNMPAQQKAMMLELFIAEMQGLKELEEEDTKLDKKSESKIIFTQYIQDLYRFYKLFPEKNQFYDIFNLKLDIHNSFFFNELIKDDAIIRRIAEYYFEKDHYKEAIDIYFKLEKKGESNYELFQKTAYSYQKLQDYKNALDYYLKAELFDKNHFWNLKKIAFCQRQLKNNEDALKYYLEAEKLEPENLSIQAYLGHSYLSLDNYEKALKHYFKVEYLAPDNTKILRPIAWCYFAQSKLPEAKKYYEKIPENEITKFDLINLGHIEWCNGKMKNAIDFYKRSILQKDNNLKEFLKVLFADKNYLAKQGVNIKEIPMMLDYLRYEL